MVELLKYIRINNYIIKLKKGKQLFFNPIYSLRLVELKILKIYIKTNLTNIFIQLFKFLVKVFIFFNQKLNKNFYLCINYEDLINLIIKNPYLFPFIKNLLINFARLKNFFY